MKPNLFWKYFIVIAPIVLAGFLLYPTYRSGDLEKKDASYKDANGNVIDSVGYADFLTKYDDDIKSNKSKRIKLGLDLRGGMYVMLEVDIVKLLEEAASRDAIDDIFTQVIEKTKIETDLDDGQNVLDVFVKNFNAIAKPQGRTLINYYEISGEISEQNILDKLKKDIEDAVDQAKEVIRQRIDKYGVSEPSIQKQGSRRIVLELPGINNPEEMRQLVKGTARLEFKLVRNNVDIVRAFYKIDEYLTKRKNSTIATATDTLPASDSTIAKVDSTKVDTTASVTSADSAKNDSAMQAAKAADTANPYAGLPQEEQQKRYEKDHPFTSLFISYIIQNQKSQPISYVKDDFPEAEYFFQIPQSTELKFNAIMNRSDIKRLIPNDLQILRSAKSSSPPNASNPIYTLYSVKRDAELKGDVVTNARASFDPQSNSPVVMMEMDADGTASWARITGANVNKKIAIVLDEQVYSAPNVIQKITGGNSQITGMQNAEEAHLLEIILKAGALKAPVKIIEERVVGPSLGEDSIKSGLLASGIAFLMVILFMGIYYSTGGMIANVAVLINVALIMATLPLFQGTLTLPGIAGIILTIAMAVDANILIFERIREELARGRSFRGAIDEGFSKALTAVIDTHITTFITGLILFFLGTGPIQGFALTLMIGILSTFFTAITVSRAIIEIMMSRGSGTISFGQPKS
ncbi:MAG: protein translocase subunit SecD [Ignavibacteria bacterium]|nr:protein translocase subunit SecD [Ignavibacteria bacterium]